MLPAARGVGVLRTGGVGATGAPAKRGRASQTLNADLVMLARGFNRRATSWLRSREASRDGVGG